MECRERILAALNLEEPDRVPCHTILIDGNNVDEILGKPQISDFDVFMKIRNESSDWVNEMSNLIEKTETSVFSRCVEAAAVIGLDCMQCGIIPYYILDSPEEKIMMGDIYGRVWEALDNDGNINPYYLYGTMDSVEKWKDVKETGATIIALSTLLTMTVEEIKAVHEALQSAGLRDKVKLIVGGAPLSMDLAKKLGADDYADDAVDGVKHIKKLAGI